MKSPFPGMDPWLEGHLWPDVHNSLAYILKTQLIPQVSPEYIVTIDTQVILDTHAYEDAGIVYPDVEIFKKRKAGGLDIVEEPAAPYNLTTPATIIITLPQPVDVKIPVVEIRDRVNNRLVTSIEILSPVNKRRPGLEKYRKKRAELAAQGVHLLEIDLLRRGERPFNDKALPKNAHYFVMLWRAGQLNIEIWAMTVQDQLPVVPVPLKSPHEDVKLDLRTAFDKMYDESRYDLSIDYNSTPPPPNFNEADKKWIEQILQEKKLPADG
jgi:hypothetical protein